MIAFGDYAASASDVQKRNDQIQQAVLAIRPYGATPTAGLMEDAAYFFTTDGALDYTDPNNGAKRFGPKDDPFVAGGCRQQFIILMTDGIPNLDLRDGCKNNPPGAPNGTCPFRTPGGHGLRPVAPGRPEPPRPHLRRRLCLLAGRRERTAAARLLDDHRRRGQPEPAVRQPRERWGPGPAARRLASPTTAGRPSRASPTTSRRCARR